MLSTKYDTQVQPPRKRHRVFLRVFLAIQVIFLIWVISAGVSAPHSGVGLQVGLWAVTDVITGASYAICRPPRSTRQVIGGARAERDCRHAHPASIPPAASLTAQV